MSDFIDYFFQGPWPRILILSGLAISILLVWIESRRQAQPGARVEKDFRAVKRYIYCGCGKRIDVTPKAPKRHTVEARCSRCKQGYRSDGLGHWKLEEEWEDAPRFR